MRLIDADALKENMFLHEVDDTLYAEESDIDRMPTIDAVQVVRCGECRWWDRKDKDSSYGYCHACKHGYFSTNWEISIYRTYKSDWYCADGERKQE